MATPAKISYVEAKDFAATNLLRIAEAQESGNFESITNKESFDKFDWGLPRDGGPEFEKLFIALNFWDGWIDARNHDWLHYEPITSRDWPNLAKSIAADLRADREISNPIVLNLFDFRKRQMASSSLKERISKFFGFGKHEQ